MSRAYVSWFLTVILAVFAIIYFIREAVTIL